MRKNNILLLFLLAMLFCPLSMSGQVAEKDLGAIKGHIIAEDDDSPVPYATVRIGKLPNYVVVVKALATDAEGRFEIKMPLGGYSFMISAVGYESTMKIMTIEDSGGIADLGIIKLKSDDVKLKEVVVKPLVSMSSSEIVYNLDQDPDRETSNLYKILDKVPMLGKTPDGRIYVGDPQSSFLVVRNGKEDALFSDKKSIDEVLKSLPAKAFASVTVKLMPESRYGDYKYVVSIEADKTNRLFGLVNMNQDEYKGQDGELDLQSTILSSYDKLRFNVGGQFVNTRKPTSRQYSDQYFSQDNYSISQKGKMYGTGEKYGGASMFSYDIGARHFITGKVFYQPSWKRTKEEQYTFKEDNNIKTEYSSSSVSRSHIDNISGGLNYQFDFSKPNRIMNVLYNFMYSPDKKDDGVEMKGGYKPSDVPPALDGNEKNNQHTVQVHYSDPLSAKVSLEAGMSYLYRIYRTDNKYRDITGSVLPGQSYDMESSKHIIRNYLNLRYSSNKFSANMKIRTEHIDDGDGTRIVHGLNPVEYISETGFSIIPQATVSMMFRDKLISYMSLSYMWDKRRPGINMLTTNTNYSNPNYIFVGNPKLSPEDTHHVGLSFNTKMRLSFNIMGSFSDNKISQYWYKDTEGRAVRSYANYGNYKSVHLTANYPFNIKKIHMLLMINDGYSYSKTTDGQATKRFTSMTFLNATIPVTKVISLNVGASYIYDHFSGMQGMGMDPFGISLSTRFKLFEERLEVEVRLSEISRFKHRVENEVNTPDFVLYQVSKTNNIPLSVSLSWRIGSFKVKPVRKAHRDAIIDDIIIEK